MPRCDGSMRVAQMRIESGQQATRCCCAETDD